MKAYFGEHATEDNDWLFKRLPRIDEDNSVYWTLRADARGEGEGLHHRRREPGASATRTARRTGSALAKLDWLVVRDLVEIESASFWYDSPEIETGELVTTEIPTEVFFLPAAAHTEKDGSFTNTQRCCSGTGKRSSRRRTAAPISGSTSTSGDASRTS